MGKDRYLSYMDKPIPNKFVSINLDGEKADRTSAQNIA
jgi:hypothetical protein